MDTRQLQRIRTLAFTGQEIPVDEYPDLTRDEIMAVKADDGLDVVQTRDCLPAETYAAKKVGDRSFEFIFSTETPDHGGDILKANGWDLRVYKTNPVILWSHDGRSRPPVGRAKDIKKNVALGGTKGLAGIVELAPEGASEFTDALFRFVEADIVRAMSVGFRFLEIKDVNDDKERERLGLGRFGVLGTRMLLLENSLVSIPQQPEALGRACEEILSKSLATKAGVEEVMRGYPLTERDLANLIDDLFKEYHAVGWEPEREPDPIDSALAHASETIDRAKAALAEAKKPESEPEPVAPFSLSCTSNHDNVRVTGCSVQTTANDGTSALWVDQTCTGDGFDFAPWAPPAITYPTIYPARSSDSDAEKRLAELETAQANLSTALDRLSEIATKQSDVIASLGDLVERLSGCRSTSPTEVANSEHRDLTVPFDELFEGVFE